MTDLNTLTCQFLEAKRQESAARDERIRIEVEIAEQIDTGEKKSKTVAVGQGLKVTVTRGYNYKADVAGIRMLDLPAGSLPVVSVPRHYEFSAKLYEDVIKKDKMAARALAKHIVATPKKVGIKVAAG